MTLEWFWKAAATAALAAASGGVGYLLKLLLIDPFLAKREAARRRIQALREMKKLLSDSMESFVSQNIKAQQLFKSIQDSHPDILVNDSANKFFGYDQTFHDAYDVLTNHEMDLFRLIQGTTKNSLFSANSSMKRWLDDHPEFVSDPLPNPKLGELRDKLRQLRSHLIAWLDKYEGFRGDKKRSLVYLGDEKYHGPPFPNAMDEAVDYALSVLERSS